MPLLIASLALDPVAGVAAVKTAVAHRDEAEISSVLAKASRSPIPEVRRAVVSLRRARRKAPREQLDDRLDLTSREIQILGLMADGALNADIARDLVLAPATVKTHVNHIFSKLGVHDRVQAVLRYRSATSGSAAPGSASTSRARRTTKDTTVG
jgi:DNA-binding NarL/FixJ family response regulator